MSVVRRDMPRAPGAAAAVGCAPRGRCACCCTDAVMTTVLEPEAILESGHERVVEQPGGWQDTGGSTGGVTRHVLNGYSPPDIIL